MARIVFLLLIFANLMVYVWAAGYLGEQNAGREPERLQTQILPEHLKAAQEDAAAVPAAGVICQLVGPLDQIEAEALDKSITVLGGQALRVPVDTISYRVFIPAVEGRYPQRAINALRKAGIKQFSVIEEAGPDHNAITFGTYPTEEAAKEKIERLIQNDIKSVRLTELHEPTNRVMLTARATLPVLEKALVGMKRESVTCPKE
jgi:hypothetical protein